MFSLPTPAKNPIFAVHIKPNAAKDKFISWDNKILRVAIKAPADKGKANERLVKFLSKELGHSVRIKSGLTSKEKLIAFI